MPAVTLRRSIAAALSTVFLLSSVVPAAVAQDVSAVAPEPVSIETALGALMASSDAAFETAASEKLPACKVGDKRTRYVKKKEWKKTLLDTRLRLPRAYKPWDLVSVARADIAGSGRVRKKMIDDLRALAKAARRAGKPLAVRSAWRSYDYQKALFASYVGTYGYSQALKFSARPGHSEHQLGTTVDFTVGPGVPLSTKFGDSPSGKWLARNGWKYGFIMSYPKGMKKWSCYGYEPWHWRYFGRDLAEKIHRSGQVPRRYLWENFETAP
ncbi:MAG: M15 family metallopeptidase [Candidatus Limnocylindrales bacterium]